MNRRDLMLASLIPMAAQFVCGKASASQPSSLSFAELYKSRSVLGMAFADRVVRLAGQPVGIAGYMAPPLKPESKFFVLTRTPVSVCPFCSSDADWPADIVVVYLKNSTGFLQDGSAVSVSGILELGSKTDSETGFVSQLRLMNAAVQRL